MTVKKHHNESILSLSNEDIKLGQKFKQARTEQGFSQTTLGKIFGISGQQIAKFESGKNRISAKLIYHMAILCRKSPEWFIDALEDDHQQLLPGKINSRFTKQAITYFNKIDDPETQKKILNFLRSFAVASDEEA